MPLTPRLLSTGSSLPQTCILEPIREDANLYCWLGFALFAPTQILKDGGEVMREGGLLIQMSRLPSLWEEQKKSLAGKADDWTRGAACQYLWTCPAVLAANEPGNPCIRSALLQIPPHKRNTHKPLNRDILKDCSEESFYCCFSYSQILKSLFQAYPAPPYANFKGPLSFQFSNAK